MSIKSRMNKQTVAYSYNKIRNYLAVKKKQQKTMDTRNNMDKSPKCFAE